LLRPGRLDKAAFCDFPSEPDRVVILNIYLNKFGIRVSQSFVEQLARKTNFFTSADLKGLCQNAQLSKLADPLTIERELTEDDLTKALKVFTKGMGESEVKRYQDIYARWQDKSSKHLLQEQKQILK
jgi:SpoVK/Ycf46/Vps4 family AAA+-type ATPase